MNHYEWLDATIEVFGPLVFGKPNGHHFGEEFITAHGDKCYSYMESAEDEHGIPKWHTAMLYLLTYTELMDRPKPQSYQWILDNHEKYKPLLERAAQAVGLGKSPAPELTVWEGVMPESNGKSNYTAVLMRKGLSVVDGITDGFTIARSEYPDRVRYEADCVRYLIGELEKKPRVTDYDTDKHSGYVPKRMR